VRKVRGRWRVRTNDEVLPRLRISKQYRELMRDPTSSKEVRRYIRDKVRAGGFLMKSIGQRQETLRRIGEEVVAHQEAFLEEGVEKLKPLTMSEIAQKLGLHETTISRAIANKYIQTPAGVFELKYFFTPGYQSDSGEMVSNKTIKDAIQKLVDNEDIRKPLSDQAMVKALQGQGLKVARRTIAKYRDELRILPSHMRKKG
jgi:RNA polymerase sigma-54 factor